MDPVQSFILRIVLSPISLIYGILVFLRLQLYRFGFLKSIKFSLPIISVGNLSVGGTGKSPHIEYLMSLLDPYILIGTLSRGYKRRTTGFKVVQTNHTVSEVGDEPLQLKKNFPQNLVAVSENRVLAIPQMMMQKPDLQCILLDDAFQHLAVNPALNILLTDYNDLFVNDYLLPSGRLREWRNGYKRADFIIVTKCNDEISLEEMNLIIEKINPLAYQKIFFSKFQYQSLNELFTGESLSLPKDKNVLLVSGIANNDYLKKYLNQHSNSIIELDYPDHYQFTEKDIDTIQQNWERLDKQNSIIITTQKDAMRLYPFKTKIEQAKIPIYFLPIKVGFHQNQPNNFDESIKNFLLDFKI